MFILYFVLCVLLPTGSISGVNIKLVVFCIAFYMLLAHPRKHGLGYGWWVTFAALIGMGAFWIELALIGDYSEIRLSLSQFKDIGITIATAFLISRFITDFNSCRQFLVSIINALALLALFKVVILTYCYATSTAIIDVIDKISAVFGTKLMTLEEDTIAARIQFVSDVIVPPAIFATIMYGRHLYHRRIHSVVIFILLSFSVFSTFSRFLWAYGTLAVAFGMIASPIDKLKALYLASALVFTVYYGEELNLAYELRTSDRYVSASDNERDEQRTALIAFFWDAPVFGHGLGTFAPSVIRDEKLKYSYELQIPALFGQIGMVGVALLLLACALYYLPALNGVFLGLEHAVVLILLAAWVSSGFFNPFLTSSSAGVSFGFFYALLRLLRFSNPPPTTSGIPGHVSAAP